MVIRIEPEVSIFLDQNASRMGLRFKRVSENVWAGTTSLVEVRVTDVLIDGARYLEVSTEARELYRNFYELAVEIVEAVVIEEAEPVVALSSAVARWNALLSRPLLLSEEAQIGLFGELWLLERLVNAWGPAAMSAWVGPRGHAHDFRIERSEIEVKATVGNKRIHTINGVNQLEPSPDSDLYLLSLKLTDGGMGGRTLGEMVESIAERLSESTDALAELYKCLERVRYQRSDAPHYPRRRKLRDVAALVPIVDGTPRLTQNALSGLHSRFAPDRIVRVTYEIDVTNLGAEDGAPDFNRVIPTRSLSPENSSHV